MISHLRVSTVDQKVPKVVLDKAYGCDSIKQPMCITEELLMLSPDEARIACVWNSKNSPMRLSIEDSFNKQMRKWPHTNTFTSYKLLANGNSNFKSIRMLHNLQSLFFNLHLCSQNHGSQVTGVFGIELPTVADYLNSANNKLLVPFRENTLWR